MKLHNDLNKCKLILEPLFYCDIVDTNCLKVSLKEDNLAFMFLIIEKAYPKCVILCLSVDFNETILAVDIALKLNSLCEIVLGEDFYYSKNGKIYWNLDAHDQYRLEYDTEFFKNSIP